MMIFPISLYVAIWGVAAGTFSVPPECITEGTSGSCDFYKCYDADKNCGSNGYLIGYGYKYCERFGVTMDDFTPAGQKWIGCVRKCLTNFLLPWYRADKGTCSEIRTAAFGSHVKCYLSCGFCDICKNNKGALLKTFKISDFFSNLAIKQVYEVIKTCGIFDCFE